MRKSAGVAAFAHRSTDLGIPGAAILGSPLGGRILGLCSMRIQVGHYNLACLTRSQYARAKGSGKRGGGCRSHRDEQ